MKFYIRERHRFNGSLFCPMQKTQKVLTPLWGGRPLFPQSAKRPQNLGRMPENEVVCEKQSVQNGKIGRVGLRSASDWYILKLCRKARPRKFSIKGRERRAGQDGFNGCSPQFGNTLRRFHGRENSFCSGNRNRSPHDGLSVYVRFFTGLFSV